MTLKQRLKEPTPPFFKKVRNAGLVLVSVSAVILASPVAMPALIIKLAAYAGIAGSVASAISQAVTASEKTGEHGQ